LTMRRADQPECPWSASFKKIGGVGPRWKQMMRLSDERSIPSRRIKKHSRTLGLIVAAWIIGFLIFMVRLILFGEGITWQVTLIFAPLCSVRWRLCAKPPSKEPSTSRFRASISLLFRPICSHSRRGSWQTHHQNDQTVILQRLLSTEVESPEYFGTWQVLSSSLSE